MGIVYRENKDLVKNYTEETLKWTEAVVECGKKEAEVKLAAFSSEEAKTLLLKLDALALERANPLVATIVAEEANSILTLARMVKVETKQEFAGILGTGSALDITWLRAKHVGGSLLNPLAATGKGVYGGTSGAVLTWLRTETTTGTKTIIPDQVMAEEAGVIYLGAIDPIEVPKVDALQFKIADIPTPAQSLALKIRLSFDASTLPVVKLEKPIIVGPEKKQQMDIFWYATGDDKFEPLALLVAKAEALTL